DEEGTQLCPRTVCRQRRARLLYLLHGRREQRFQAATSQIRVQPRDKRPQLWFMHVLLPHEPLRFLPSGRVYEGGADPEPGLDGNESFDNEFLTQQAEQRHLLQLEFADRLLRDLLARLRKTGLYDKAMIVVTADHGITFRVKSKPAEPYRLGQIGWRRDLTVHNAHDVAFVPLLVKKPRQETGAVDDSWARTVDILPTLLREAQVKQTPRGLAGWRLGERRERPRQIPVLTNRLGALMLDPAALARKRAATVERRAARFGIGSNVDRLFRIGPNTGLIGLPLAGLRIKRAAPRARFWGARRFLAVNTRGTRVPANVIGWLDGRRPGGRDLALALNGRIASVGRSFKDVGELGLDFSLLAPESAFRDGPNDLRLFEVTGPDSLVELGRAPGA
ncbi:MAG: sulfatase-like hydrolase/transferase, partial [Thermoleophilaceae bacterium]